MFAQINWAKGYTKFLENRATVAAALSRIALNSMPSEAGDLPGVTSAPRAGWTTTITQAGAAGGALDVEFTDPANAPVTVNKSSGSAGYQIALTQPGSDGLILGAMLPDDPIMSGHLFLYSAETPAGLDDKANLVGQIED